MTRPVDALPFDDEVLDHFFPDLADPKNWHEATNIYPVMNDVDLAAFAEKIRQEGQQMPIAMFKGKVLDGRNRARACAIVGKEVRWETVNPPSPLRFVVQRNLDRTHLKPGQLAGMAFKLLPRFQAEAQQRQRAAGKHGAEGGRGHKKEETLG